MKMSTEFECGQILFNLKHSNLHYLIKETHLSAYITIRNKLRKELDEMPQTISNDGIKVNSEKIINEKNRMENGLLKKEINELKAKCELIEIEKEELERKNETLERNLVVLHTTLVISVKTAQELGTV